MGEQVTVRELPLCDICLTEGVFDRRARYDGKTKNGAGPGSGGWGFMCDEHFASHGVGLGTGKGQKLMLPSELKDEDEQAAGPFERDEELEIKLSACAELGLDRDEGMAFLEDMGEV